MTNIANKDARPEGGLLLQARMYGGWNEALFVAQSAMCAGRQVSIDAGEHPSMRGITLQRIEVQ